MSATPPTNANGIFPAPQTPLRELANLWFNRQPTRGNKKTTLIDKAANIKGYYAQITEHQYLRFA